MRNAFFQTLSLIFSSIKIRENYLIFQEKNIKSIISYLLLLWTMSILCSFIPSYFTLEKEIKKIQAEINEKFPNFTINQYGITVAGGKTFLYTNVFTIPSGSSSLHRQDEKESLSNATLSIVFILDKENIFTETDLVDFPYLVYLNDTSFLIKRGNLPIIQNRLKEIKNLETIDKAAVQKGIGVVWQFTLFLSLVFVLLYSLALHLAGAFVMAFVTEKILKTKLPKLSFQQISKVAIYAFTPAVLLKTFLNLFTITIPYLFIISYLLGFAYLVRGLLYTKENLKN